MSRVCLAAAVVVLLIGAAAPASAGPPSATTSPASSIGTTTATLNGLGNPNGEAATGWFRYGFASPGTCNDTFGTRAPSSGGSALGAGFSPVSYSQGIVGLIPGASYYFCAIVQNSSGTSFGALLTFSTETGGPTVITTAATSVTSSTATLNGTANPNGEATTGWFRYDSADPGACDDSFGTRAPSSGGSALGSGTSPVSYSQGIAGLLPGTTYYFCAIAENSSDFGSGAVLSFTTAGPPTATTAAATAVTSSTATLNGSGNPNGDATTGWFRYSTTSPGTCNDSFGTRAPASGGSALGAGTSPVSYSEGIAGLLPGTTYFFCAIASNSLGTAFGAVLSFTTNADAPTATTSAATAVTSSTATLNGSGNPNGDATTGWFRYSTTSPGTCNDSFGTRAPASGGAALGAGTSPVSYSEGIAGLLPGTTYHFCAIAANSNGTAFGALLSFSTNTTAPTATTAAATAVTSSTATLNGSGNPNGDATTGWFRYSTTSPGTCNDSFGTRAPASGGAALGAGTSPVSYSEGIAGLLPGTTYHFCAIAANSNGTAFGALLSFSTNTTAPTVTTAAATAITSSTATLNGSGNPNGDATTGWFRYSTVSPGTCNDSFGTRAPASGGSALGSGTSPVIYSEGIAGLLPGTTYHFCAIAANSNGTAFGALLSFTSNTTAPTVTTAAATAVTSSTATLNGSGNPNGDATTGWFRYSTTSPGTCNDSFGTRAPASGGAALGAGGAAVPYSEPISGLAASTSYYFCAIAANSNGTGFGAVMSFVTGPSVVSFATVADTGDGLLAEGERTIGGLTQLLVQFSGAMADPPGNTSSEDVTNPANYRLFAAGPNGQLETASCGVPVGDDVTIVVAGVDYAAAPFLAALSFAGPFALDEESYRLAVCATLQDPAGQALEAASRTFYVLGSDRFAQPNFDDDLAGWTISDPVPGALQWSSSDAGAAATSGAAEIVTAVGAGQSWLLSQCIELPERRFLGRVRARIQSPTALAPVVRMAIEHLAGAGCTGASLGVVMSPAIAGDSASLWATSTVSGTVPAGAQSALVTARVDGATASTFTAALDDLFYGDPVTLFVDGFESGGLSRWSLAAP